jgi:hypothetical protein
MLRNILSNNVVHKIKFKNLTFLNIINFKHTSNDNDKFEFDEKEDDLLHLLYKKNNNKEIIIEEVDKYNDRED